jgi:chemotaxis protein MotB
MAEENEGASGKSEQPIIIKKIKGHGGHGGSHGSWKVAYADFMTAMMAFFIVMWILASSAEVKEAVAAYFNSPESFNIFTGVQTAPVTLFDNPAAKKPGKGGGSGQGQGSFQFSFGGDSTGVKDSVKADAKLVAALKDSANAAKDVENTGNQIKNEFQKMKDDASVNMKDLLNSVEISITNEGLLIELVETHDNNFFDVGSAKLRPEAIVILKELAKRLGQLGNHIEIEGHTDSRGYTSSSGYGNWDLSTDRANAARRVMASSGLWPGQITEVAGFADRKLKNPNNPFDASNRRVSILVRNLTANEFMNSGNTSNNNG